MNVALIFLTADGEAGGGVLRVGVAELEGAPLWVTIGGPTLRISG
jgi:hypothetical protein